MDTGGPFDFGDFPEEDPTASDEEAGGGQRGWLPPDDRLWRHPSEIARLGPPRPGSPSSDTLVGALSPQRLRLATFTAGLVGAVAVAATVVVVLSLVEAPGTSGGDGGIEASTTSMTTAVLGHDVMGLVDEVRPSLVDLEPLDAVGASRITGVVLPGGSLVVTAASAVGAASTLEVVSADGRRRRGEVLGTDMRSGVAVVSTGGGLVPATFADEDLEPDDLAVVACMCGGRSAASLPSGLQGPSAPDAGVGMVTEVGTGVQLEGGTDLVNAIEAELPLGPAAQGGVLLDGRGRVIGILDGHTTDGGDTVGVFVPAPLAESVALELAQAHQVHHGWLGIECADGSQPGAMVTGFLAGSPAAAAGLRVGDVVVALDSHPVDSMADLQERLYTVPPGATVQLSVVRAGGTPTVLAVRLASQPAN